MSNRREFGMGAAAAFSVVASSRPLSAAPVTGKVGAMSIGVQTHFAQGRPPGDVARIRRAFDFIDFVRDEIYWEALEAKKGIYQWDYCDPYVFAIRDAGLKLLLTLNWSNSNYQIHNALHQPQNGILIPDTSLAQAAFGAYALAILDRYESPHGLARGVINRLEVWNEANGSWGGGYKVQELPAILVELTAAVHKAVRSRPEYNHIEICGGASVLIPSNFLEACFEHGLAKVSDAVAVHPYLRPEIALIKLEELKSLAPTNQSKVDIWATEFGDSDDPGRLIKMLCVLSAAGIPVVSYYQAQGPKGALLDRAGNLTKTGGAFASIGRYIVEGARAERRASEPRLYIFAIQTPAHGLIHIVWTMWGACSISIDGAAKVANKFGEAVSHSGVLSVTEPVLIMASSAVAQTAAIGPLVGDSFSDYSLKSNSPWRFLGGLDGQPAHPLVLLSDQYGDYYGDPRLPKARLDRSAAHPDIQAGQAYEVVRRWVAPRTMAIRLFGRIEKSELKGQGTTLEIRHKETVVFEKIPLIEAGCNFDVSLQCQAGDAIDFVTAPFANTINFAGVEWLISIYQA